jgi:hypothetical protein
MNIRFLEPARAELIDTVNYYNRQRQGLGVEFAEEVRAATDRIIEYPEAWPLLQRERGVVAQSAFPTGSSIRSGATQYS